MAAADEVAEPAVVVADRWHRLGFGTALLAQLAERARAEGITRFSAIVLAENRDAVRLLERLGEATGDESGHQLRFDIVLPDSGGAGRLCASSFARPPPASSPPRERSCSGRRPKIDSDVDWNSRGRASRACRPTRRGTARSCSSSASEGTARDRRRPTRRRPFANGPAFRWGRPARPRRPRAARRAGLASTCSATPAAAPSPRNSRGRPRTVTAGSCQVRPRRVSARPRRVRSPRSCWSRRRATTPARARAHRRAHFRPPARPGAAVADQAAARLHRPPTLSATPYQLYAAAGWSSLPWLDRVPHPNLIVEGEEDRSVPLRIAPLLVARLPDARLHVVKGGGHPFLLEEPHTRAARARPSWTSTDGPTSNWARL